MGQSEYRPDGAVSIRSADFLELAGKVMLAHAAFEEADLSRRGADLLIELGYWEPGALVGIYWEDRIEGPGLDTRLSAIGCDAETLRDLRIFHHWHW